MQVQIYIFPLKPIQGKIIHEIVPTHLGYAEVKKLETEDDAEEIWNLCNWSHCAEEKPQNLHANISTCGHGLCLVNPETQERYLALSNGWLVGTSTEISDYVLNHKNELWWEEVKRK